MYKKSQIQMAESVAVVIIIIFLLVIGLVFWMNIRKEDTKTSILEYQDLSVIELAKIASEFPEFKCYNYNAVSKVNCFDWYKLLAINETIKDSAKRQKFFDYYNSYFKSSKITIKEIYPNEIEIIIYDNNISKNTSHQINIPIVIEKNLGRDSKYSFGLLVVEGYFR